LSADKISNENSYRKARDGFVFQAGKDLPNYVIAAEKNLTLMGT
jgi:hypothetical protein